MSQAPNTNQAHTFVLGTITNVFGEIENATITYDPLSRSNRNKAELNEAGEILLKKKMIDFSFVYSGWSKDRGMLLYDWNDWLEKAGLWDPTRDSRMLENCRRQIQERVKAISNQWIKLGYWTIEGQPFCSKCKLSDTHVREDINVRFQSFMAEQAGQPGWDGEFKDIGAPIICYAHLTKSLKASMSIVDYSRNELLAIEAKLQEAERNAPEGDAPVLAQDEVVEE